MKVSQFFSSSSLLVLYIYITFLHQQGKDLLIFPSIFYHVNDFHISMLAVILCIDWLYFWIYC